MSASGVLGSRGGGRRKSLLSFRILLLKHSKLDLNFGGCEQRSAARPGQARPGMAEQKREREVTTVLVSKSQKKRRIRKQLSRSIQNNLSSYSAALLLLDTHIHGCMF